MPEYQFLVDKAIADNKAKSSGKELLPLVMDDLLVLFGTEILKIVPGRVSTETDANMSFDTDALVAKGRKLHRTLQSPGHRARTHPHQDRLHVGRHPRGGNPPARRHQLQSDAALLARPGRRVRRGEGAAHLAVRRPHHGLVQGEGEKGFCARRRSRRDVREGDLFLLQKIRLHTRRSWARASATWAKSRNSPAAIC